MNRRKASNSARTVALSAVLTALSLIVLYIAALAPSGRMGLTAAAGLFPAAAVVCYGGTAVLALLFLNDKGLALLYLVFFGLYPMLKGLVEQMRRLLFELLLKLAFFNVVLTLLLLAASGVLFSVIAWGNLPMGVLYMAGNAVFLIYDFGFSKIIGFYTQRVDRVLRKT